MKQLILLALFFSSLWSLAQPGKQKITFSSKIKFMLTDSLGETVTPANIKEKNFVIHTYYGIGKNTNYEMDSAGIISHSDSVTINLFSSPPQYGLWDKNAWVISIQHNGNSMRIYASGSDQFYEDPYVSPVYIFSFEPGNYFAVKTPLYYKDGCAITNYLVSLDETQPDDWEESFKQFHVREKLGME